VLLPGQRSTFRDYLDLAIQSFPKKRSAKAGMPVKNAAPSVPESIDVQLTFENITGLLKIHPGLFPINAMKQNSLLHGGDGVYGFNI